MQIRSNKEVRAFIKRLPKDRCQVVPGSRHYKILDLGGRLVYTIPASPSDHRWIKNATAALRRANILD